MSIIEEQRESSENLLHFFEVEEPDKETEEYSITFKDEVLYIDSLNWRNSWLLKYQIFSAYLSFILFGLAEQAVGTLITTFQEYYHIGETKTSFIFLATVFGYFAMAIINEYLHSILGLRGVNCLGGICMFISYLLISTAPPFVLLVPLFALGGVGFGCMDASFNSWMGTLVDSNQLLGMLHGFYGVGAMISPTLLSNLLKIGMVWNYYYLLLAVFAFLVLVNIFLSFQYETPRKYEYLIQKSHDHDPDYEPISMRDTLRSSTVWILSIVLFIYVGAEVAFGSWLITYLLKVKKGDYVAMSYIGSLYWTGLTVGRMFLGFLTARLPSEIAANKVYTAMAAISSFLFWTTPNMTLLVIFVFITGVFVGPIFPASIVVAVKILPVKYHISGIGFACAFGGSGAAVFPFLIGVIAETKSGLYYYPLICSFLFLVVFIIWGVLGKVYGGKF